MSSVESQTGLLNTLYINVAIFCALLVVFEINRHFKSIYFPRLKSRFKKSGRVPPEPSWYPFAWIAEIANVSEAEVLRMVGLDGYMMIRYLSVCFRVSLFLSFFGLVVLVPVYSSASSKYSDWNRFTLANIPNDPAAQQLWVPVVFSYVFAAYYCYLMHAEYKNFMEKRLQYLKEGDTDTPIQTYYTVMVEHLPAPLRSAEPLFAFFEKLFPGDVYSVEVTLDLKELDSMVNYRREVRDKLEKMVALYESSNRRERPLVWFPPNELTFSALNPAPRSGLAWLFGVSVYDGIDHYSNLLDALNDKVAMLQHTDQRNIRSKASSNSSRGGESSTDRISRVPVEGDWTPQSGPETAGLQTCNRHNSDVEMGLGFESTGNPLLGSLKQQREVQGQDPGQGQPEGITAIESGESKRKKSDGRIGRAMLDVGVKVVGSAAKLADSSVGSLAKEAKLATSGTFKGVMQATRTLELLTFGANYKTSTTAFVTLKSRVANCSAHQMLLSHGFYTMVVKAAPNPKDIIWDNVSTPERQIAMRRSIADVTLMVGALFWSIVVGFITACSNLESLSKEFVWLQLYQNTDLYALLNSYLAMGALLVLLSALPAIFDLIARNYECMKLESEIQNVIMSRYFYYQLANVFVALGLGSIASSLHEILSKPASILTILGAALPSFSTYFTNLVIVKTFTAVPLELLRIWPLIEILSVQTCLDKRKCTRRELRTGAFADPPMLYGWVYPNILMVMMIMLTYSTISPVLTPFAMVYFGFAYVMYKYQLLYVFINSYQSGGFMWYAVFNRSMVALILGVVTLLCYLLIRETFFSGPFYLLLPLPFIIAVFWVQCESKFKLPTMNLSLESAIELDQLASERCKANQGYHWKKFKKSLFKQPSLAEGRLRPAPYRKGSSSFPAVHRLQPPRDEVSNPIHLGPSVESASDISSPTHPADSTCCNFAGGLERARLWAESDDDDFPDEADSNSGDESGDGDAEVGSMASPNDEEADEQREADVDALLGEDERSHRDIASPLSTSSLVNLGTEIMSGDWLLGSPSSPGRRRVAEVEAPRSHYGSL